ncbi:hypothetical protein D3C87_1949620 [compost metagenome]
MNEPHPTDMPPASEPKIPGKPEPTDSTWQSEEDTPPLLEDDNQEDELEDLEPDEPVGAPGSNQQVP